MKLTPEQLADCLATVGAAGHSDTAEHLEGHILAIEAERDELREAFDLELDDWASTDTAVHNALKPFMDVEGDSYGVPGIQELVDNAAAKITAWQSMAERLAGLLPNNHARTCSIDHIGEGCTCNIGARRQALAEFAALRGQS